MFKKLGSFVIRFRALIVVSWVVAAAGMFFFAPSLSQTGEMNQSSFLPSDTESQQANELISKYFPGEASGASGTLVFYRPDCLTQSDLDYTKTVQDWLLSDQNSADVTVVTSIFNSPEASSRLMSPDKTTMLMNFGLGSSPEESRSGEDVQTIRQYLNDAPTGLEVYVSGSAGIYSDLFSSLTESLDLTTIITVVLVIVLLLIIYRSPIASLVPLFTIGMAYLVARGVLGLAAQAGISIWSQIDVFLIVLVFGAGTDYCLFMISRFREELRRNETRMQATKATVTRIGAVITASAFAVIIGLSGMAVARFQMIGTMGPVLAVSILITLFASLTLTPALASLFGKWLFWPAHSQVRNHAPAHRGFWSRVAGVTTGHPMIVVPVVIAVMAAPLLALPHLNRSYDQLAELPSDSDSASGFRVLTEHFNVGEMDPLVSVVVAPQNQKVSSPEGLAALLRLGNDVRNTPGVAQVQSIVQPYGTAEIPVQLTASGQLAGMVAGFSSGAEDSQTTPDFAALISALAQVNAYLSELKDGFAWVENDASYVAMLQAIQNSQTLLESLQSPTLPPAEIAAVMARFQQNIASMSQQGVALAAEFVQNGDPPFIPSTMAPDSQTSAAMNMFVSQDGQASRIYVVLDSSPQSNEAMTAVSDIRKVIESDLSAPDMSGYQAAIGGSSATLTDMRTLLDSDFTKVQIVVIGGVFLVFVLLLRSLVAPLYLLLTVLLSYGSTLGLVTWIFQDLQGLDGVSFIVPLIVFVLLVALGADYNIFLMSRVKEESESRHPREATRIAAGATGAVITACGIILAGTFAALIVSPLRIMVQVGAAVAIGILIDTFVVRSLLVPAIATVVGRKNWWPSRFGLPARQEKEVSASIGRTGGEVGSGVA